MSDTPNFRSTSLIPPQNIEVEEAILGGILLDPEAIGRVAEKLIPEAFYIPTHTDIYKACLALNSQGKPTDLLTVTDWLIDQKMLEKIGGQAKLIQLLERTVSAVNIDSLAVLVMDKYIRRELIKAGTEVTQLGFASDRPLEIVLDESEQQILNLTQARPKQGLTPIKEIVATTYQEIQDRHDQLIPPGLTSDFSDLDGMTGGFQRSDLIIIAGRPSMGKTAISLNIAYNMAKLHQQPVLVFSLEMSKDQLVQRLIASEAGVDSNRLRAGRISPNEWDSVYKAVDRISELPIFIDDNASMMVMEMRSQARKLQAENGGKLGLIMIDYLQLMEGGGDNRVQEISKITRSLKGLARELQVPLIALSQLSRSVEARNNKRPMMSDLRESGCLTGDTLITMADTGIQIPIRDLVDRANFAVWALDEENMQLQRAIVSNAFATGVKPVWKLQTQSGRTIKATANHKFLTIRGWKRLDELAVDDRLAVPRKDPTPNRKQSMSNAEIALLGHLIGDGCTLPRHSIQYTTREADLAHIVADLATEIFGDRIIPRIQQERDWYQVYLTAGFKLTHNVKNPITEWLDNLKVFGLRSHEKFVPDAIFSQPQAAICLFLRHLWSTDGCIYIRSDRSTTETSKTKIYPAIYYSSSSNKLAANVQSLLLRLEINATLRVVPQIEKGRDQYHVSVSGKDDMIRFINLIGAVGNYKQNSLSQIDDYLKNRSAITNRDVIPHDFWRMYAVPAMQVAGITTREFQAQLGNNYCGTSLYKTNLSRERAAKIAIITKSLEIENLANSDIYWDKIVSITPDGESDVYDLTVPQFHNFVANNIIAHNSIEQDADLIIMLYRDAYYNPDTPDRDITELIITKHRNGPTGVVKLVFDPGLTKFKNLARPMN
ncbi:replicative DNA helicase [Chamaesiphon polymorphus]|uniref:Replicative DNA helicase n=1 Tax=Chamaesiphon polymorphus CCALA 037 TaxID=2107692 RepID=A0A2T1GL14_9CYAN|nr:replicative DNA helicase [Chamaesiphon polymorphus]PSB58542.1 replicative DNA helicase [Chamaesiphon polymorphus CCALA 037]